MQSNENLKTEQYMVNGRALTEEDFSIVQQDKAIKDEIFESEPIGFFKDAMLRFSKNKAAIVAAVIVGFIILMAIIGPSFNQHTYRSQNIGWDNLPPRIPYLEKLGIFDGSRVVTVQKANIEVNYADSYIKTIREFTVKANNREVPMAEIKINIYKQKGAESEYFWFGSDGLGRDLWTRLWRGARISLLMSLMALVINLCLGVLLGSLQGYYGGWIDLIIQRISEVLSSIPTLPLLIIFIVYFGASMIPIVLALCLTGWIGMSNMIRAQFYKYKSFEYVMASRTMGARDKRLIFRHILPNAIGPTITQVTMAIPGFIMFEASLAYLGLGVQAPESSIGVLLSEGQALLFSYSHLVLFPAIIISLLMLSFNLVNNGLRDAFDPTLRGQE